MWPLIPIAILTLWLLRKSDDNTDQTDTDDNPVEPSTPTTFDTFTVSYEIDPATIPAPLGSNTPFNEVAIIYRADPVNDPLMMYDIIGNSSFDGFVQSNSGSGSMTVESPSGSYPNVVVYQNTEAAKIEVDLLFDRWLINNVAPTAPPPGINPSQPGFGFTSEASMVKSTPEPKPDPVVDSFEKHTMYDCATGKEYKANEQGDHDRYAALGYVHDMNECPIKEKPEPSQPLQFQNGGKIPTYTGVGFYG